VAIHGLSFARAFHDRFFALNPFVGFVDFVAIQGLIYSAAKLRSAAAKVVSSAAWSCAAETKPAS
jgi:hypothetical protein